MTETFGARLRQRREQQQIDLRGIAEQTKIKLSLLEALERDDVSHWPSGIYRRAYVRAYARLIGLDPDAVVREFLEAHPEPDELATPAVPSAEGARSEGGPPTRLRNLVGSALGSLARLRRGPDAMDPPASVDTRTASPQFDELAADEVTVGAAPDEPASVAAAASDEAALPSPSPSLFEQPVQTPAPRASFELDFPALARLCTEIVRVESAADLKPLLGNAARILDAAGVIIWVWDPQADGLRAVMVHGYPEKLVAQLPAVRRDAENATAAAFRSAQPCAVKGSADANAALVVPLIAPAGCSGVLAVELPHGREETPLVCAAATILAAMLAPLTARAVPADAQPNEHLMAPAAGSFR